MRPRLGGEEYLSTEYAEGLEKYITCHGYSGSEVINRRTVYGMTKIETHLCRWHSAFVRMPYSGSGCESILLKYILSLRRN
jgi:hypothetical protein